MNNKKCKKLRKMANSLNKNEVSYNQWQAPKYQQLGMNFIKVEKGTPLTLNKSCARSIYKNLKAAA